MMHCLVQETAAVSRVHAPQAARLHLVFTVRVHCMYVFVSCMQAVDRFNNLIVTAFVTPGNTRFLLLHDGRNDDACRAFFMDVYELYVKVRCKLLTFAAVSY